MLTPQEVSDQKFEKAMFGGYEMAAVDDFLERLTTDYGALYKENTVLKSKLKVLVDTVEEYRSVDEAMRRTLFTAQRMADDMARDAKVKYDEIIRRANYEAGESVRRLKAENDMEQARHKMLKDQTEHFTQRLAEAYAKQIEAINAIKMGVFQSATASQRDHMAQAAQEISASVQATLSKGQTTNEAPIQAVSPAPQTPPAAQPMRSREAAPPTTDQTDDRNMVPEPQPAFEITLKGQHKPFESDDLEDTLTSRPKFDFPNLQSQFGQQYSSRAN